MTTSTKVALGAAVAIGAYLLWRRYSLAGRAAAQESKLRSYFVSNPGAAKAAQPLAFGLTAASMVPGVSPGVSMAALAAQRAAQIARGG